MSSYDRALSVFSPDGRLLQVEYGQEAVKRGTTVVGVKGDRVVVLGVEKKSALKLQDLRTLRKIGMIDDHLCLAFAGLSADARILLDKARLEAQSHKLSLQDPCSVEYMTRFVAGVQQRFTQAGGVRPFGVSTLIVGFNINDTKPQLYQTDPAGIYSSWKANSIGRSSKTVREFLEKNYKENMSREATVHLAIQSLLEVVQTGAKNIEIVVLEPGKPVEYLDFDTIEDVVKQITAERENESSSRRGNISNQGAQGSTQTRD